VNSELLVACIMITAENPHLTTKH